MIVVDVNILVYLFTDVPERQSVTKLRQQDPDWRLPGLWRDEFLNVLATLVRTEHLAAEDAQTLWQLAKDYCQPLESELELSAALGVAIDRGISAYDAQYLALAEQLDVMLVTNDRKLIQRAGGRAIAVDMFLQT